jgi:ubiquinone/menaquinone biosynthesis C-methylase UbiE
VKLANRLVRCYFDLVYNRVYDFSTAHLNRYQRLQRQCLDLLEFRDNDRVLCAGVGTGNEVLRILEANQTVNIVGIDYSRPALRKAYSRALKHGKRIDVFLMDARHLDFPDESFDAAVCLHVMDFVKENVQVTAEILRVLKKGGQFVITYPSIKEGPGLARALLANHVRHDPQLRQRHITSDLKSAGRMLAGIVYLPFLMRPKPNPYSRSELRTMIGQLASRGFHIEEDPVYQDFIVYGRKEEGGN